jgi:hypothetical protein
LGARGQAEGGGLSEGEIGYVRQMGALAGASRFCHIECRPLYKAFIRT